MKPIFVLACALPLLTLSCGPLATTIARINYKAKPIDNRTKDLRLNGSHYGVKDVDFNPKLPPNTKVPRYPTELRDLGIEGTVSVVAVIDKNGNVTQVETIRADDQLFAHSVEAAVKTWKFSPAKLNGKNVSVWWMFSIRFTLVDGPIHVLPKGAIPSLPERPASGR